MKIQIANMQTGEVVECRTDFYGEVFNPSLVMKIIRGRIRQWMNGGLNIHEFKIIHSPSCAMSCYLIRYAWEYMRTSCDCCGQMRRNSDLHYVDDSEGVCLATICHTCSGTNE